MALIRLVNPTLVMNNAAFSIVPNTFVYTEGLGEQDVKTQSAGGGSVETVFSGNIETNMSMVKFSLFATLIGIDLARTWKINQNKNALSSTEGGLVRIFNNIALVNDYEVALGSDTTIDLEFKGDPVV